MSLLTSALAGFDRQRVVAMLRTACGAMLAMVIANVLGSESPGWAAMTVFLVSQPTRGLLQARSFYRVIGTVVGAVVGALFIVLSGGSPVVLVLLLASWLGLCSWVGNVARQLGAYGALLSGYTAAIVSLLSFQHHENVALLALDRIEGVLIGAAIAMAINGWLTPRSVTTSLLGSVPGIVNDMLGWAARMARHGATPECLAEERALVRSMADIESGLDEVAFGSRRKQREMAHIRGLFAALLTLGSSMRAVATHLDKAMMDPASRAWRDAVVSGLNALHGALAAGRADAASLAPLRALIQQAPAHSRIRGALENLALALAAVMADRDGGDARPAYALHFHRDWAGARLAAFRTVLTVLVLGAIWVLTGWEYGAFMVMGAGVFLPLFSNMDKPSAIMRNVALGSAVGVLTAVAFTWLVLPAIDSPVGLLLAIAPVLAVGALALSHRASMPFALDFCMVFLLVLHPSWPLHTSLSYTLGSGQGLVLGLAAAWLSFSYVVPLNGARRLSMLAAHIVRDIEYLARSGGEQPAWKWRARMHHRILRLVARATAAGSDIDVGDGMAALSVGDVVLHIQALRRQPGLSPEASSALDVARAMLGNVSHRSAAAADALRLAARELALQATRAGQSAGLRADAEILREAADTLLAHTNFFAAVGERKKAWLPWGVAG